MQKLLIILLLGTLLFGCTEIAVRPPAEDKPAQAQQALDDGEYTQAIELYNQLAAESTPPLRYEYQYRAALAMFRAGLGRQATQQLEEIPVKSLSPALKFERQLLLAEIQLKRDPELSLKLLQKPATPETQLPDRMDLFARYHQLRAQAYARQGKHLETAREYIQRDLYLSDEDEIQANQQSIWQSLSALSEEELGKLRVPPPPNVLGGWIALVKIAKNYSLSPSEVQRRIYAWQQQYPHHPAREQVLTLLLDRSKELATRPRNIALLLPLSGHFASAGESILDGIFAAYYQDPQHNDIQLRVYDIGEQPEQAMNSYWQAMSYGAEFVIGPLDKSAVTQLAQTGDLPLPTLALNYVGNPSSSNLYQFGLAPEDEAREVAERAWLEGYSQAAVMVPNSSLGQRLSDAFKQRLQELGGQVVTETHYNASNNDYSDSIKKLLNLDDSEFRKQRVRQLLREPVEFTPRRRQDIDFVFLAAFPQQARLIRPQLKFFHASDLPVLATSHLFTGVVNQGKDRDMDDIMFCDMPWTLNAPSPQQQLRNKRELQLHSGQLQRLVALGIDSYQLVSLVPMLASHPMERYRGETGTLRIDEQHRILRQLLWARFSHGQPELQQERIMDDARRDWQNTN